MAVSHQAVAQYTHSCGYTLTSIALEIVVEDQRRTPEDSCDLPREATNVFVIGDPCPQPLILTPPRSSNQLFCRDTGNSSDGPLLGDLPSHAGCANMCESPVYQHPIIDE